MDRKKLEQSLSNIKLSDEEIKYNNHLEEPVIKDYDQFTVALKDALNQFPGPMMINLHTDEKLVEKVNEIPRFYLEDYLKTQNKVIDSEFYKDQNIIDMANQYNAFVDQIKKCSSKKNFTDLYENATKFAKDARHKFFTYIRNKEQFEQVFYGMKDQFESIKQDVINELPFNKIKQNNKGRQYKTFDESLESTGKILSDSLRKQDSYTILIRDFDDIVLRLKSLNTEEELHQIIEEINEFLNI